MKEIPKQECTTEFKAQAVKRAQAVSVVVAAKELGLVEQTLRNWVKAAEAQSTELKEARVSTPPAKPGALGCEPLKAAGRGR